MPSGPLPWLACVSVHVGLFLLLSLQNQDPEQQYQLKNILWSVLHKKITNFRLYLKVGMREGEGYFLPETIYEEF